MPKRVGASLQAAFVLFIASTLVAFYFLRGVPEIRSGVFLLAISVPAIAALAIVVLTLTLEGLLPERKLVFPVNLTLPLMHVALMAVLVQLMMTTESPLQAVPDRVLPALIWEHWNVMTACALGEMTLLSLLVYAGSAK